MEVMAVLLEQRGVRVDAVEEDGYTPLMIAAGWGRTKICEMLLALGADPSLKEKDGKTALDCAWGECAALLQPVTPGS